MGDVKELMEYLLQFIPEKEEPICWEPNEGKKAYEIYDEYKKLKDEVSPDEAICWLYKNCHTVIGNFITYHPVNDDLVLAQRVYESVDSDKAELLKTPRGDMKVVYVKKEELPENAGYYFTHEGIDIYTSPVEGKDPVLYKKFWAVKEDTQAADIVADGEIIGDREEPKKIEESWKEEVTNTMIKKWQSGKGGLSDSASDKLIKSIVSKFGVSYDEVLGEFEKQMMEIANKSKPVHEVDGNDPEFIEQKELFDKMCRDNYFLQMVSSSDYDEIRYTFLLKRDVEALVNDIMADGSTAKNGDEIKEIVNRAFDSVAILEDVSEDELSSMTLEQLVDLADENNLELFNLGCDTLYTKEEVVDHIKQYANKPGIDPRYFAELLADVNDWDAKYYELDIYHDRFIDVSDSLVDDLRTELGRALKERESASVKAQESATAVEPIQEALSKSKLWDKTKAYLDEKMKLDPELEDALDGYTYWGFNDDGDHWTFWAEMGYKAMEKIIEELDKIAQEHDKDIYWEMESPGRAVLYGFKDK